MAKNHYNFVKVISLHLIKINEKKKSPGHRITTQEAGIA